MADNPNNLEKKEELSAAPKQSQSSESKPSPKGLDSSRQNIAGALEGEADAGGEMTAEGMESSEKVSEMAAEGREKKGDGIKKGGKKDDDKKDDGKKDDQFVFDETNLPPAPAMIKKIEKQLRKDIGKLEKQARKYHGGLFRKANYSKYSETMIEIRKKTILLKRLLSLAADQLKRMFLQMFGKKQ
jgi:hypothetical protein